jgi:hypothetical protein
MIISCFFYNNTRVYFTPAIRLINEHPLDNLLNNNDDLADIIDECLKLMDENVDILNDMDYKLQSEKEDILVTDLTKNDLIDMAHEVSDSSRIKKAESFFVKRLLEKSG